MSTLKTLGPVGFNPRGEYNLEITYDKLDMVLYNGVSYIAKQTVQGELPTNTTYWDALGISGADISGKEDKINKTTSISLNSTDTEYPSAKSVYTYVEAKIGEINTYLDEINGEVI